MLGEHRKSYRQIDETLNIPAKANRILNLILAAMLLIVLRVWYLAVIQYDEKLEEARKPQRRIIMEPAKRATIRDRFNVPLAINKAQYNVAILYSPIKQIPAAAWVVGEDGKRTKRFKRKEYISALSQLLGEELQMDPNRIEDLIHSKAALYNQLPYTLKENISESSYYRLKMLEKDWVGVQVQSVARRYYPYGKIGADIIGYMGAINSREYERIISEIKALESHVEAHDRGELAAVLPPEFTSINQVHQRLKDLHELAYTVNDSIGKMGIEARYEKLLRGFRGKKSHYSDARGKMLRALPGTREPLPGQRLLLTISAELQEYAEHLLIQNEKIRQTRLSRLDAIKHTILADKEPWIKGGAIIAMDPNNGEILALASHPSFDPNDFISSGEDERQAKQANIRKWLESESYLGEIWNEERPLEREAFDLASGEIYMEQRYLTWETYLDLILAKECPIRQTLSTTKTIKDAIAIQKDEASLIESAEDDTYDQILLLDLLRMLVPAERFSPQLLHAVGKQSLTEYKQAAGAMVKLQDFVKKTVKELFHEVDFKEWRKLHEKAFLKQKREEEKAAHRYAKPYIDYLDALEIEMFTHFWEQHRWQLMMVFLTEMESNFLFTPQPSLEPYIDHLRAWKQEIGQGIHPELGLTHPYAMLTEIVAQLDSPRALEYLQTLRGYHELTRPLLGKYRYLRRNKEKIQQEKHLAAAFYPKYGYGYGRSQAYRQATTQGSLFKLITAYEALAQRFHKLQQPQPSAADLNPLTIVDTIFHKGKELFLGYDTYGQPLPRHYKGGRLPRSSLHNIGETDLLKALEMSSNPYFALLAGDILSSPQDLANAAKLFSYGYRTGINLPGEISGHVPEDLDSNRTGLYAMSIGQHTLVVTPLQTAVMLSTLANGGKVLKPKIVNMMVGKEPKRGQELVSSSTSFPYEKELAAVGIDFPLFIAADAHQQKSMIKRVPTEMHRQIFLPTEIQKILLEGMCRVVVRSHGESLNNLSRMYQHHPEAISDYVEVKNQLLGKTSTSEVQENIDLDLTKGTNLYTHVWFGGISYKEDVVDNHTHRFLFKDSQDNAELIVVVYLRYGGYGKEAGPIAAQIAKKWKEIKSAHL